MIKSFTLFVFCIFFTTSYIQANTITVKGHVTLTNGAPAKNVTVKIATYFVSASTSCSEQTTVTNNDGFYSKEMTCTGGDIKKSRLSVVNCDGQILVQEKEVSSTKVVEVNFTLCIASAPTCAATFTFEKLTPKKFRFNSSKSTITANDNIIERKWNFGDGAASNDISPAHEFPHYGNYEVCLSIKTAKGCESKVCVPVKVEENAPTNDAQVTVVSLYPVPAHENVMAVIYSKNDNVQATVSIVDIYGKVQSSQQVTLLQGNNSIKTRVYTLPAGSYYYKITTKYGALSKSFYKL